MKQDIQRIMLASAKPLFLIFILYILKVAEVGMDWDFSHFGVYPLEKRGITGILSHPLIHSGFSHLLANTLPFFFLSWCLFYFYRGIAGRIFLLIWVGCGLLTFLIGKPGWHIGASGLIYGLAFFLFFSGILRKYTPLIAISLLVTFLYGGIVWHMFPSFSPANMSWEGHLSGGIMGTLCAFAFVNYGPQRPEPFANEKEEDESPCEEEETESMFLQSLNEQRYIGCKQPDGDSQQNDSKELANDIDSTFSEKTLYPPGHAQHKIDPHHV